MANVQEIFDKYLGKPVEAEDPSNLDQCMDWVFKYLDEVGIPRETIRHLYAYQAYLEPNDTTIKYFELVPNTPNGIPEAGDIPVFSAKVGPAGHICVATGEGDANSFKSADQNWNGHHYVEYINHPYDSVLGWLHPRSNSEVIAQPTAQPIITDQTKIPQIDGMEVLAIHSTLMDLNKNLDDYKLANRQQADMLTSLRGQLTDCQKNISTSAVYPPISVDLLTTGQLVQLLLKKLKLG